MENSIFNTMEEKLLFKEEMVSFCKNIYQTILNDYGSKLPLEKQKLCHYFIQNTENVVMIDDARNSFFNGHPARYENDSKTLHFTPTYFQENFEKLLNGFNEKASNMQFLDNSSYNAVISKMGSLDFNTSEEVLMNIYYRVLQGKDNKSKLLNLVKSVAVHEIFHSIIDPRDHSENAKKKITINDYEAIYSYGTFLNEGMVELYARNFCIKHGIVHTPGYQNAVNEASELKEKLEAKLSPNENLDQFIFTHNITEYLEKIHDAEFTKDYNQKEQRFEMERIKKNLKESKENYLMPEEPKNITENRKSNRI